LAPRYVALDTAGCGRPGQESQICRKIARSMNILTTKPEFVGAGPNRPCNWREAMRRAIRDPVELCQRLGLDERLASRAKEVGNEFGVFVPLEYLERIRMGDWEDPLLRQVFPYSDESNDVDGFVTDPVGDGSSRIAPGLLHKYQGRVLLVVTGQCAVHCRYCFRRHYPYAEVRRGLEDWLPSLRLLAEDRSITEVLLSGGDPLTLGDQRLGELVHRITQIPHVRRLRIHTRLPIVIPQRVTEELIDRLVSTRLSVYVVVHVNHAQELDRSVLEALAGLVDAGLVVLNQSVLLRGVNDSLDSLVKLSERLVDHRVMPYYLHQLDRVAGASHYEVPEEEGLRLVREMRKHLPGYAVPRYVRETAGETHKTILA